jgi:O-antigen ligase
LASEVAASVDRWRPWLLGALCALWVARPLFPSESAAEQGDGLPMVMLWLALAIFWLLGVIGQREWRIRFGWTDAAMLMLVGCQTLAALWGAWLGNPRPAVNMLWEWIAIGLSFFLVRQLLLVRRETRAVMAVMVALAVAVSAHGLYQYFYELPATRAEYRADPDRALRDAGLWFDRGSREREMFENRLASVEPLATFALTNSLAGYLSPWLIVALGIGVGGTASLCREGTCEKHYARFLTWSAVGVSTASIALCLLLTKSRSACVAVVCGMLLVGLFLSGRLRLNWKLLAVIAVGGAILLGSVVMIGGLDRWVWSEASKSLGYRVEYWQATLRMIADHPLAGCGPGHFQDAYTAYKLPQASEEIADPHNFLLEIWATAGTPTVLALVGMLGLFFWSVFRPRHGQAEGEGGGGADAADSTRYVFGGAMVGVLLSVPLGLMSSAPPGLAAVMLGLPVALVVGLLLWPWVDRGQLPRLLPAMGVVVLLVNLLAAGGIGLPAVSGTLWLLLAMGLSEADPREPRRLSIGTALLALVVGVILAVACYASAYAPVMKYQATMRSVLQDSLHAEDHLREAAAADPWSPEPWNQLANLAFERWKGRPDHGDFLCFEQACEQSLARHPNASSAWLHFGDCYMEGFGKTGDQQHLAKAIRLYERAASLYPNNALSRARLAAAYRAAGRSADFQREAARALELDKITPHADKKLPEELRNSLKRSSSSGA